MITFNHKCPVCKDVFSVEGVIRGWSRGHMETELTIKVKIPKEHKPTDDVLPCSTDCYTLYREAKVKANEAYDAIMEPYRVERS